MTVEYIRSFLLLYVLLKNFLIKKNNRKHSGKNRMMFSIGLGFTYIDVSPSKIDHSPKKSYKFGMVFPILLTSVISNIKMK